MKVYPLSEWVKTGLSAQEFRPLNLTVSELKADAFNIFRAPAGAVGTPCEEVGLSFVCFHDLVLGPGLGILDV